MRKKHWIIQCFLNHFLVRRSHPTGTRRKRFHVLSSREIPNRNPLIVAKIPKIPFDCRWYRAIAPKKTRSIIRIIHQRWWRHPKKNLYPSKTPKPILATSSERNNFSSTFMILLILFYKQNIDIDFYKEVK